MTESEAIEILKGKFPKFAYEGIYRDEDKYEYEMAQLAIQALEKQIPKKPIFDYNLSDTLSKFHCECGNVIKVSHDVGIMNNNNAPNYCSKCGCRLDWSDENDD